MCARAWQLGCGSSPAFSLTPPNLDWAGKSPPVPPELLPLLYPVFCPSQPGIVMFSCWQQQGELRTAALRAVDAARTGLAPSRPCAHHSSSHPWLLVPAFSLAGISLCSATPWQAPAEVTGAAEILQTPEKPKSPQIPAWSHRGTEGLAGARPPGTGTATQENKALLSVPLPCLAGNILPGNQF